jgi:hypothetical protein
MCRGRQRTDELAMTANSMGAPQVWERATVQAYDITILAARLSLCPPFQPLDPADKFLRNFV